MNVRREIDGQISVTAGPRYWASLGEILDLAIQHQSKLDTEKSPLEPDELDALLAAWQSVTRKALKSRNA